MWYKFSLCDEENYVHDSAKRKGCNRPHHIETLKFNQPWQYKASVLRQYHCTTHPLPSRRTCFVSTKMKNAVTNTSAHYAISLITSSTSSFENIWNSCFGVIVITSTFVELSFSSITCFRIVKTAFRASFSVMDWKQQVWQLKILNLLLKCQGVKIIHRRKFQLTAQNFLSSCILSKIQCSR